jgi:coenzyme F420 hydrogenase subunit beta
MATTGMDLLKKEVLGPGLCVGCGGCVGLCPHISFFDGKVICTDLCDLDDGRCYAVCPMAVQTKSPQNDNEPVGMFLDIYRSRAKDNGHREKAQYGGTVSMLIITALEEGLIDEAILTGNDNGTSPCGVIAKTAAQVIACGGSRYTSSASLEAFNKRSKEGPARLGTVVLPCQARSLTLANQSQKGTDEIRPEAELVLGLFCTWALKYRKLKTFMIQEGLQGSVSKYDIPPPPADVFQIITDTEMHEFPLADIREFVQAGCAYCEDLTAEFTDISVGAVEGMTNWNTLIVRTGKGKDLVDRAVAGGILVLEELPEENRHHLFEASRLKRQRGKENWNKRKKK